MFLHNNLKKSFRYFIISLILTAYQVPCDAAKGTVNILTRQGYLKSPEIASAIRNECGVEISYDEYDSGLECYKKFSTAAENFYYYDIIIFPALVYELIKQKTAIKNSDLNKVVKEYSHDVKSHYLLQNYPSSVVYFTLPFFGFVWNPKVIELSTN